MTEAKSGTATTHAKFEALYELFARLASTSSEAAALDEVLTASMEVVGADGAYIRLFEPRDVAPEDSLYPFVVNKGFSDRYLKYFSSLSKPVDRNAREAVFNGRRVIIEDMTTHPSFRPHREVVLAEGYRSMQATPLMRQTGSGCIGVICTCFFEVYLPPPDAFDTLDLYAEIASAIVGQHQQVAEVARRDLMLIEVVEKHEEVFRRIEQRLATVEQRAFSLDPDEIRSILSFITREMAMARASMSVTDAVTRENYEPGANPEFRPYDLSPQELRVLVNVWRGLSDKQIALRLGISRFTVAKHLGTGMRKLGVETRTQASVIVEREALYKVFEEN